MAVPTALRSGVATRAVERALDLLAAVCAEPPLTLTECARRAELPASTALRLLRTLEMSEFVRRDPDGNFRPGARVVQIGAAALGRESIVELAEPGLHRIVAATGESAYLSVRGPGETALYVAMVEGTHAIRHTSWVGRTVPLAGTAVGAVFAGATGRDGYVVNRSGVEPDVTAVAAPVRRTGGVAAAISVVGPSYRLDDLAAQRCGHIVREEAEAVSLRLTPPGNPPRAARRARRHVQREVTT